MLLKIINKPLRGNNTSSTSSKEAASPPENNTTKPSTKPSPCASRRLSKLSSYSHQSTAAGTPQSASKNGGMSPSLSERLPNFKAVTSNATSTSGNSVSRESGVTKASNSGKGCSADVTSADVTLPQGLDSGALKRLVSSPPISGVSGRLSDEEKVLRQKKLLRLHSDSAMSAVSCASQASARASVVVVVDDEKKKKHSRLTLMQRNIASLVH